MFSLFFSLIVLSYISHADIQLSEYEARHVLSAAGWDQDLHDQAISVIKCESSLMPRKIGDSGNSLGLFQIQWEPSSWVGWKSYPGMIEQRHKNILQPIANAQAAFVIYKNFGWNPWTCQPKFE
jgi:hypothetical protein